MNGTDRNSLVIRTPEGITFSIPLAGPVTRFFAWVIDMACISVLISGLSSALMALGLLSMDIASAATVVAYFIISIGYGMFLEWRFRGQTIGKRLLKLRVMDEQGFRLQFSQVGIRNLLRFVDTLPVFYLIGGVACLLSRRGQRLGDYAANTVVVRGRPPVNLDLEDLKEGKYNSFRDYPFLEARLRHRASPEESGVALQALMRRGELDPLARVELFRDIAAHFKSLVAFPEEATFGLTDEQYIRNVVDSVFRERQ